MAEHTHNLFDCPGCVADTFKIAANARELAKLETQVAALVAAGTALDDALRGLTTLRGDDGVRANWWRAVAAAKGGGK